MLSKAESSNNRQLNALAQIGFSSVCSVCVCPIGQLFRTNWNTRLDTRASSQLALRRLNFPRLELISCAVCGKVAAWLMTVAMRFQLVSNGHNATEQERGREGDKECERELALCCGCFQFVSVQTRTVTHSSQFIFHFPHNLSISTRRHIPAEAQWLIWFA